MRVIMLVCWVPLSAADPQAFGVLLIPPPLPFSGSLKHDCQCGSGSPSGRWLPSPLSRHPIPARLGPQMTGSDLLAQVSCPAWRDLDQAWNRGWEVGMGTEEGGRGGHIWSGISFPCFLSARFLPVIGASGARPARSEVRGGIQGADKYWKWRLIILRGENAASRCEGLQLIRLFAAGVKRGNTSPFLWKKYKQVMYSSGHPPSARPPWNNPHQQPFLLHLSACIASPWLPLSCSAVQPRSCSSESSKYLRCLNQSTHSSRGLTGGPLPASHRSSFNDSWWGPRTFMHFQRKRVGMRIKLGFRQKPVLQDESETERAQQDDGGLRLSTEDRVCLGSWLIGLARAQPEPWPSGHWLYEGVSTGTPLLSTSKRHKIGVKLYDSQQRNKQSQTFPLAWEEDVGCFYWDSF